MNWPIRVDLRQDPKIYHAANAACRGLIPRSARPRNGPRGRTRHGLGPGRKRARRLPLCPVLARGGAARCAGKESGWKIRPIVVEPRSAPVIGRQEPRPAARVICARSQQAGCHTVPRREDALVSPPPTKEGEESIGSSAALASLLPLPALAACLPSRLQAQAGFEVGPHGMAALSANGSRPVSYAR
ncbi:uncharacterized protein VTP21DRAFT_540 [Calcarisporiella thermophila]|uniref:uncharacterized protein n=1 Tax=Calcarisporiella thermophila TaxID=911321 RepID=UPI00374376E9